MEDLTVGLKNLTIIFLTLSLSACGTNRIIKPDFDLTNSNYVVFVVGIDSESEFTFLENKGGNEEAKPAAYIQWRGKPQNGYIVGGSDPSISVALMEENLTSLCGGGSTIVFEAPNSPKVIYLTDIKNLELESVGNSSSHNNIVAIELEENFEKAKAYIDNNFPNLAGKLEHWPYKLVPTEACTFNATVPVIIF